MHEYGYSLESSAAECQEYLQKCEQMIENAHKRGEYYTNLLQKENNEINTNYYMLMIQVASADLDYYQKQKETIKKYMQDNHIAFVENSNYVMFSNETNAPESSPKL